MGLLLDKIKKIDEEMNKYPLLKSLNESIDKLVDAVIHPKNSITSLFDSIIANKKYGDNYLELITSKYDYSVLFNEYESLFNQNYNLIYNNISSFLELKGEYENNLLKLKQDIGNTKRWKVKGDPDEFISSYVKLSKFIITVNKYLNEKGLEQMKLLLRAYKKNKDHSILDEFHKKMLIPEQLEYLTCLNKAKSSKNEKVIKNYSPFKTLENVLNVIPLSAEEENELRKLE